MSSARIKIGQSIRKRLFVGLLALSFLILVAVLLLAWWVVTQRSLFINKIILTVVTAAVFLIFFLLLFGLAVLIWSLWRSKTVPSLQGFMYSATNILFPMAIQMGKWLGMDEDRIKNSYIQVSNQLIKARLKPTDSRQILILAPHCLQWHECPHKITIDINNCKRCGQCQVHKLLELGEKYNVRISIVTGGTSARKIIREIRPLGVVAIACERDLTSGIQDTLGYPVYGVINERPQGPCHNTRVDLVKVEEAIKLFTEGG